VIWIISGPTNAGKSTFIRSPQCSSLTSLPIDAPAIFPFASTRFLTTRDQGCLYHYNILRSADIQQRRAARGEPISPKPYHYTDFDQDLKWREIVSVPTAKAAIVLVIDRKTLLERAVRRQIVEYRTTTDRDELPYPNEYWLTLCARVDLTRLYQAWCAELQRHGIDCVLLDSRDDSYPHLSLEDLRTLENA
jgi:hypothetical protein